MCTKGFVQQELAEVHGMYLWIFACEMATSYFSDKFLSRAVSCCNRNGAK